VDAIQSQGAFYGTEWTRRSSESAAAPCAEFSSPLSEGNSDIVLFIKGGYESNMLQAAWSREVRLSTEGALIRQALFCAYESDLAIPSLDTKRLSGTSASLAPPTTTIPAGIKCPVS